MYIIISKVIHFGIKPRNGGIPPRDIRSKAVQNKYIGDFFVRVLVLLTVVVLIVINRRMSLMVIII